MSTPFSTQLLGQTEKTLNAILDRTLAGRVTEPEWVALVLLAADGGAADRAGLTARAASALKLVPAAAAELVAGLESKGLIAPVTAGTGDQLALTGAGSDLLGEVRVQVAAITERLWGDLAAADLEAAGRVLAAVLERAEAELAQ
jgi:hypothetical protein